MVTAQLIIDGMNGMTLVPFNVDGRIQKREATGSEWSE
jgi:hypothetical protein